MGNKVRLFQLIKDIEYMIVRYKVHNINFVTPDHFIPHVVLLADKLKKKYSYIPILFNVSGYQSVNILKEIKDYVDIYLPDFKYSDNGLASSLSLCSNYSKIAIDAISEMVKQKGFLKIKNNIAINGVLVRHLILPGKIKNSLDVLSILYGEFGKYLPISLMSQYRPILPNKDSNLNRFLKKEEFYEIYNYALELGFENMFVQFPHELGKNDIFLPDFTLVQPFRGNINKGFDTKKDL